MNRLWQRVDLILLSKRYNILSNVAAGTKKICHTLPGDSNSLNLLSLEGNN